MMMGFIEIYSQSIETFGDFCNFVGVILRSSQQHDRERAAMCVVNVFPLLNRSLKQLSTASIYGDMIDR